MDPITALTIASTIVTFVDFATKIVTGTYQVYNSVSGTTEENAHIDTIISDLREVTDDLDSDLELASKCEKLSGELLCLLENLAASGNHSTWKSLKVKIMSMHKEKEVARIEKRLGDYRSQILLRLTLILSDQQSSIKVQLDQLGNTGLSLSTESATHLTMLREDILGAVRRLIQGKENLGESANNTVGFKEGMWEIQDPLKALSSMISAVPRENCILQNLLFRSMNLREESIASAEEGTFKWIFEEEKDHPSHGEHTGEDRSDDSSNKEYASSARLPNLEGEGENGKRGGNVDGRSSDSRSSSPAISDSDQTNPRESSYSQEEKRNRWEEELERRARTRVSFLKWLGAGGGVFHISGKAGSGKSTLMKFLCGHERTEKELKAWAGEKKLVFARFFFWRSNDDKQMSLEGLYRSILFETLKQCPELIPVVFPTQWEQLGSRIPYVGGDFLGASAIQSAFQILVAKGTFQRHRFCFFVDGLDEYHGDSVDHVRLAESLQLWASRDDVKICTSSRPYIEFLETFSDLPDQRIRLHELTRHDIYLFSRQMIERDRNFKHVEDTYLWLVDRVVEMSEGVFLWARLVVRSLLAGILRHDTVDVLEKKLEVIPRDINGLYDQLLDSLEPDDRQRAAKMLLLTVYNPFGKPLNSVVYAWIDNLSDPQFPPTDGNRPSSWPPINDIAQDIQRQLTSLTKGLLDTVPIADIFRPRRKTAGEIFGAMQAVQFFHRTVRDFVLQNSKLENITSQIPNLIEVETYHRLWLAEMTLVELPYRLEYWNHHTLGTVGNSTFQQELPVDLLNGFSRVLDDGQDTIPEDPTGYEIFRGCTQGVNTWTWGNRLSFVHLAAHTGQQKYVFQETLKNPELLNGNGELHILLSAAVGDRRDLVLALLDRGSSPMDYIACKSWDAEAGGDRTSAFPIWMVLAGILVGRCLDGLFKQEVSYEVLELLLQHEVVDTGDCLFLIRDGWGGPISHFITLRQFIQDVQPPNMDRLLTLLNRGIGNPYANGARRFLSRFTPLFKETESVVNKETSGYTRFHPCRGESRVRLASVIWGNLRMDDIKFRIF
ncbi:MAG: hypothetical protein M1839_004466 [Geoglossum umbratile]|nr:MAG: hypothetical protein M1839_004466 [Geoglossum umbratile]